MIFILKTPACLSRYLTLDSCSSVKPLVLTPLTAFVYMPLQSNRLKSQDLSNASFSRFVPLL